MRTFLFSIITCCILTLNLKAQPCKIPMATNMFKSHMSQLALQPNDSERLNYAKSMLKGSCLLSSQIKDFAIVFSGDYYRYQFCKKAYKHTFDTENFYDVYDAFIHLSNAIRLYDFVNNQPDQTTAEPVTTPSGAWYPNLSYPTHVGYNGAKGCSLPLAENDFDKLASNTRNQNSDKSKRKEALKLINGECISMSQAMKLAMFFELETNRLIFLKESFPQLYDLENYPAAAAVFSHMPYKYEWNDHCFELLDESAAPTEIACEVTNQDYEEIKNSIKNVSVNSTRVTMAKQIISSKKCFSVQQLRGIVKLFSIESSRYEIAEYSYEFCIDPSNFYQITEEFSTTSSKNKMLEFLESKK